jgi:SNF2 family DNA or RNA helicase
MEKRSLKDFIIGAADQITQKIRTNFSPIYDLTKPGKDASVYEKACQGLGKKPFEAQQHFINALCLGYKQGKKALACIAEMASGKTLMGTMVAQAMSVDKGRPLRSIIVCPPSLVSTWKEEIQSIHGNNAKIIDANSQDSLSMFQQARLVRKQKPTCPEFWIIGFNRAKLGTGWKQACYRQVVFDPYTKRRGTIRLCDKCSEMMSLDIASTKRVVCENCQSPFWGPDGGIRRFPPGLFIKKYLKGYFDLLLVDEVHQMKGGSTIQGALLGQLAKSCGKTLILTGTLSGGKATDIFYILQRTIALNYSKEERKSLFPDYSECRSFIEQFGTLEKVYKQSELDAYYGRTGKQVSCKEKPGISPLVLKKFFIENSVFMRLSDIAEALPSFREELEFIELPDDLQEEYNRFQQDVRHEALEALKRKDYRVLGQMINNLLAWPDFPQKGAVLTDSSGHVVASAPKWDIDRTPKDERLVEILKENKAKGRKVLIFVEYTGPKWGGDIHVAEMLRDQGFNPIVLKSTVSTSQRLAWIRKNAPKHDCLICQPKLVEVGMNLLEFPEIVFYQTGYNTYSLRQASRRSYRPKQQQNVVVRYLINQQTAQEHAMGLIATKLEAALILEGELSDKGLVALSEAGDSMAVELARSIVNNINSGIDQVFSKYKKAEVISGSLIDDDPLVTTTSSETTTTITKGKSSASFGTRMRQVRVELVGRVHFSPATRKGKGEFLGTKVAFSDGNIVGPRKKIIATFGDGGFSTDMEGEFQTKFTPGLLGFNTLNIYRIRQ